MSDAAVDATPEAHLLAQMDRLKRYARRIADDPNEAEDLVHDAVVRMLPHLRDGSAITYPLAYAGTVVRHLNRDRRRRAARRVATVSLDTVPERPAHAADPQARIFCDELIDRIDALPEAQRQVLRLTALEGMSYAQTAEALQVPIGTVMSRLSRARAAIRRDLEPDTGMRCAA